MKGKPGIGTAIPRRRYRLGEFTITVLGEIESTDGRDYRYIAGITDARDPEPGMYVTAERGRRGEALDMRIIMRDGAEVIDTSDAWADLDAFVEEVIRIASKILRLSDETAYRLM
ncbi:MAG: hypothetical protein R3308_01325 [Thiohalobacterales bacterium]|nr:hypothetical protein [Thiohalobacterales bacterium]